MALTVRKRVDIEVDELHMNLAVRYDDEDMPFDFPKRDGKSWSVEVDLATGKIKDWPGPAYDLHMKVCDEGTYALLSAGNVVAILAGEYVPNGVVPGEYGDYVDLRIQADGTIANWPKDPDLSAFDDTDED